MGKEMKALFTISLVLLLPSLYTIALMAREWSVGERVYSRLHVEGEYLNLSPRWKGHSIRLTDEALPSDPSAKIMLPWGHKERPGRVKIEIDGKDFSWPHDVAIRPGSNRILGRYHHWIFLGRLQDKEKSGEEFLVVQRFIEQGEDWYRIIRIPEVGTISEEVFSHSSRTVPVERMFFVRLVYPNGIGIYSDVLQVWPSIIYPIAYPAGTVLVGALLLCIALWKHRRKKKAHPVGTDNDRAAPGRV